MNLAYIKTGVDGKAKFGRVFKHDAFVCLPILLISELDWWGLHDGHPQIVQYMFSKPF